MDCSMRERGPERRIKKSRVDRRSGLEHRIPFSRQRSGGGLDFLELSKAIDADDRGNLFVGELAEWVKIPAISSDPAHRQDMVKNAEHLMRELTALGYDVAQCGQRVAQITAA